MVLLSLAVLTILLSPIAKSQTTPLPVSTSVRKSFLGGSYVLQVRNTSNALLALWLEAKEKSYTFSLPPGTTKDIGWAQGFKFDANDAYFISGNGFDTLKQVMPSPDLSPYRIAFPPNGGLAISFSQSFLQNQLPKYLALPIKQSSRIVDVAVTDVPEITLKDGSDRVYANIPVHTSWVSGKAQIPMNAMVSFVPQFDPSSGKIVASSIKLENIQIEGIPGEWLNDLATVTNSILPLVFGSYQFCQLDKTVMKYIRFFNVQAIVVRGARLEVQFL